MAGFALNRRTVLVGLAAAALPRLTWAEAGAPAFVAAAKAADGGYALHGLDPSGRSVFALPLPGRGHAACAHPVRAEAVAFARRPGTFALVIDCATGAIRAHLTPPDGRQFNGHGTYAQGGALLLTSEVVAETSAGRIGLWETEGYRRISEWTTGGIGPHDIRLLPDGTLVVANGGIRTDPDDRTKLNVADMAPNLTYLSAGGQIAEQVPLAPELNRLSIRHLAQAGGAVAFAMQWEGDATDPVPLLGLHRRGKAPVLAQVPEAEAFAMRGYAGSIAASGDRIALTSAKGGAAMLFDSSGAWISTHHRADLSGVAAGPDGFRLTDGSGAVWRLAGEGLVPLTSGPVAWDNHLVPI